MRRALWLVLVVCLFLSVSLPLSAQKYTGTIRGAVTDPSGAMVNGAEVTIKNTNTGDTRTVTTNAEGEYVADQIAVGSYEVTVKKAGFKEAVSKGVDVHVSSTATVNIALQLGNVSEQVSVEANAVQVETSTGTVGNVVEGKQVRELPLNGRSFVQLTQLMPGVSPQSNFDSKNKGLMAGVDFSVNGNSTTGNIFLVDGVNNNDIGSNRTILVYPSIDAIDEFKILRNSYGPEYGQAMGAVINIVTRGGTNQFHGGAFYYGRNDKLNATDFFNTQSGIAKDVLRRNDWGYNFGGPIVKDKLFFFWSEEWNRELRGKARAANVPTVAEKNGDYSDSALRLASDGSSCDFTPTNPGTGGGFDVANGINPRLLSIADIVNHHDGITPTSFYSGNQASAAGALIAQIFPDPNLPQSAVIPGVCNNWAQSLTAPIFWRQESIRMDYKLAKTWSLFGRFTQDHWSQPYPSTLGFWGDDIYPSVESNWVQPGYQATIKLTKLLGNTAVNDFQLSYASNRITATRAGTNPGLNDQINQASPTFFDPAQKFAPNQDYGYPVFWGGLGNGANSDNLWTQAPWHNNEELYILKDDFSKVLGSHTFKVGFLASNNKKNELVNNESQEQSNYWGAASHNTNNGTFNALWNQVDWGFGELQTNPFTQTRWHDFEFYYGDTWKARRNLTVEYGFRWALLRAPFSATDQISSFQLSAFNPNLVDGLGNPAVGDACNGMLVVPGTSFCQDHNFVGGTPGLNRSLRGQANHAISPRLGIAWDPKGDGKMSVRAGVGQFFQRERLSNYLYAASNTPFALNAGGTRFFDVAPAPGSLAAAGAPSFGLDPTSNLPNTWQWNLTVERELYRNTKLELAYVGNRGIHLLRYIDGNPVPAASRLAYATATSNVNQYRPANGPNCATVSTDCSGFGAINSASWGANSNYHALQALFRTKMKALDAQFAYTWSRSLADTDITNSGGGGQLSTLADQFNPHLDYGPTPIDRRHVFVANFVYNLPTFAGHNAITRTAFGGWELASILDYASGPAVTTFIGGANPDLAPQGWSGNGTGQSSTRPNAVAGQSCRASGGPATLWLNPNKWDLNNYAIGTFGSSTVGICAGPGLANTDFSVYKNFKVTERVGLQFRMEFYNLFNKTQFRADSLSNSLATGGTACTHTGTSGDPLNPDNNSIDDVGTCGGYTLNNVAWNRATQQNANFGLLSNDRGPREIQYALKFTF